MGATTSRLVVEASNYATAIPYTIIHSLSSAVPFITTNKSSIPAEDSNTSSTPSLTLPLSPFSPYEEVLSARNNNSPVIDSQSFASRIQQLESEVNRLSAILASRQHHATITLQQAIRLIREDEEERDKLKEEQQKEDQEKRRHTAPILSLPLALLSPQGLTSTTSSSSSVSSVSSSPSSISPSSTANRSAALFTQFRRDILELLLQFAENELSVPSAANIQTGNGLSMNDQHHSRHNHRHHHHHETSSSSSSSPLSASPVSISPSNRSYIRSASLNALTSSSSSSSDALSSILQKSALDESTKEWLAHEFNSYRTSEENNKHHRHHRRKHRSHKHQETGKEKEEGQQEQSGNKDEDSMSDSEEMDADNDTSIQEIDTADEENNGPKCQRASVAATSSSSNSIIRAARRGHRHHHHHVVISQSSLNDLLEVGSSFSDLNEWSFDIFAYSHSSLISLACYLFHSFSLCKHFPIYPPLLSSFIHTLASQYSSSNPYHSFIHAVDVMHCVYMLIRKTEIFDRSDSAVHQRHPLLQPIDILSLLIAAVAHDVGHPGTNDHFQVATSSPLALLYNDQSVLEHMHSATLFTILTDPSTNLLSGLSRSEYLEVRRRVIACILATDLSHHFELMAKLDGLFEKLESIEKKRKQMMCEEKVAVDDSNSSGSNSASSSNPVSGNSSPFSSPPSSPPSLLSVADRQILLSLLLHSADVSNATKPFSLAKQWSDRIYAENLAQGDLEKERGQPVSVYMDRDKNELEVMSLNFIDFLIAPMSLKLAQMWPSLRDCAQRVAENREKWWNAYQSRMDEEETADKLKEAAETEEERETKKESRKMERERRESERKTLQSRALRFAQTFILPHLVVLPTQTTTISLSVTAPVSNSPTSKDASTLVTNPNKTRFASTTSISYANNASQKMPRHASAPVRPSVAFKLSETQRQEAGKVMTQTRRQHRRGESSNFHQLGEEATTASIHEDRKEEILMEQQSADSDLLNSNNNNNNNNSAVPPAVLMTDDLQHLSVPTAISTSFSSSPSSPHSAVSNVFSKFEGEVGHRRSLSSIDRMDAAALTQALRTALKQQERRDKKTSISNITNSNNTLTAIQHNHTNNANNNNDSDADIENKSIPQLTIQSALTVTDSDPVAVNARNSPFLSPSVSSSLLSAPSNFRSRLRRNRLSAVDVSLQMMLLDSSGSGSHNTSDQPQSSQTVWRNAPHNNRDDTELASYDSTGHRNSPSAAHWQNERLRRANQQRALRSQSVVQKNSANIIIHNHNDNNNTNNVH